MQDKLDNLQRISQLKWKLYVQIENKVDWELSSQLYGIQLHDQLAEQLNSELSRQFRPLRDQLRSQLTQ